MLTKTQVAQLKQTAQGYVPPVLTLYADVYPASRDRTPQALRVRARETMKALEVPSTVTERVAEILERPYHGARTLMIIANGAQTQMVPLAVELPVTDPASGHLEARWGEPYLAPFLLALDDYERYGVIFVDRERWRVFEVFLGECEEILTNERWALPSEDDRLQGDLMRHPAYMPTRDAAARQRADDHIREMSARLYRDCARELLTVTEDRGMQRLILMGPERHVHMFQNELSQELRAMIVSVQPSLSSPSAGAQEVLGRVRETIEQVERDKEDRLLNQIRERGTWGLENCLEAMQNGQLHEVAVPWSLEEPVYRNSATGYITATRTRSRITNPGGGECEPLALKKVLPELAAQFNVRVDFLRGESRERLISEFGGMAGLKRWPNRGAR